MAHILIVDGTEQVRDALCRSLALREHEVDVAENAEVASRLWNSRVYDIAIIDIVLPSMQGVKIISDLRGNNVDIKIITISSGGLNDVKNCLDQAEKAGSNRFLAKPFHIPELVSLIDELTA